MEITAKGLLHELCVATDANRKFLKNYDDLRMRLGGPFYPKSQDAYDPENHAYEWCTNIIPQLVYSNPKWKVRSRRGGHYALNAKAVENAMNRLTAENELETLLADGPVLDMQFAYGVVLTTQEASLYGGIPYEDDEEGDEGEGSGEEKKQKPYAPKSVRVSPKDHAWDVAACDYDLARWKAHRIIVSKKALLERAKSRKDEGWNLKLIEALTPSEHDMAESDQEKRRELNRDEIAYWCVWVPEWQQDGYERSDGYNGTLVELVETTDGGAEKLGEAYGWLRKPRAYYGPRWGPYTMYAAHKVSDESFPLAPLVAVDAQVRTLNAQAKSIIDSSMRFKRMVILDELNTPRASGKGSYSAGKKLAQIMAKGEHLGVYTVAGFDQSKAKEVTAGGISREQLEAFQVDRDRLDRVSGLFEAMRGNTQGGETATANVIANEAASRRVAMLKRSVVKATIRLGQTWGWYLHNDNRVQVLMGADPSGVEVWFEGGPMDENDSFDLYEYDIEPYSMERTSEALMQRQAAFLTGALPGLLQVIGAMPYVNATALLSKLGDALNMPDLPSLIDPKILSAFQGIQMQAMMPETQGVEQKPQGPQLSPRPGQGSPSGEQVRQPGFAMGGQTRGQGTMRSAGNPLTTTRGSGTTSGTR